jgi:hypothetical protein
MDEPTVRPDPPALQPPGPAHLPTVPPPPPGGAGASGLFEVAGLTQPTPPTAWPSSTPMSSTPEAFAFGGGGPMRAPVPRGKLLITLGVVLALVAGALGYFFLFSSPSSAPQALALSLTNGQSYQYKVSIRMSGSISDGSRSSPVDLRMQGTMAWKVTSVDADGTATVDATLSDLSLSSSTGGVSAAPDQSMQFRVTKDGRMLTGGTLTPGGGSSAAGLNVPGSNQFFPVLPDHPVKEGETWDRSFSVPIPFGEGTLSYTTHNKLVRYESYQGARDAVISTSLSVPLNMTVDLRKLLQSLGENPKSAGLPAASKPSIAYTGKVDMTLLSWIQPTSGGLDQTRMSGHFKMSMAFSGFPASEVPPGAQIAFDGDMTLDLSRQ